MSGVIPPIVIQGGGADKFLPMMMMGVCCCLVMCSVIALGGHTCTKGTYDTYDFDSAACLELFPGPSPSPENNEVGDGFPADIAGLTGRYTTDSYESGQWKDVSGKDNHATVQGSLKLVVDGDHAATPKSGDVTLIYGDHTTSVKFPAACMNETNKDYTLAYVGKYAGDKRGRIFDGVGVNWLSGWHGNRSGYAYHGVGDWLTVYSVTDNKHNQALMMGVDQKNLFRSNGTNRTKVGYTNGEAPTSIAINGGMAKEGNWGDDGEVSDFALGEVLIYNRELSDVEINRVEKYLKDKFFLELQTPAGFVGQGWRRGEPGAKNAEAFEPIRAMHELSGSQEHCRLIAKKSGKAVWGHRNETHAQPEWRNTCFFYDTTENFNGYVDDTSDAVHTMGCADADKDIHKGCQ